MIIGEMQDKLARWSTENKERKFDRLLRLITDRTWLALLEEDRKLETLAQLGEIDQPFQQGFAIDIEEAVIESVDPKPEGLHNLLLPVRVNRNGWATAELVPYYYKFSLQLPSLARRPLAIAVGV